MTEFVALFCVVEEAFKEYVEKNLYFICGWRTEAAGKHKKKEEKNTEEIYQHKNMEIWKKNLGTVRKREDKRDQMSLQINSTSLE